MKLTPSLVYFQHSIQSVSQIMSLLCSYSLISFSSLCRHFLLLRPFQVSLFNIVNQGSANFGCSGTDDKYFRLCSHRVSTTMLCYYSIKSTTDKTYMTKCVFLQYNLETTDIEVWILCNFYGSWCIVIPFESFQCRVLNTCSMMCMTHDCSLLRSCLIYISRTLSLLYFLPYYELQNNMLLILLIFVFIICIIQI